MTSHRIDQPFATLCAGIVIAVVTAWIISNALNTGRVNTGRGILKYAYREANPGKFWIYLFFVIVAFIMGVLDVYISINEFVC